MQIQIGNKIKDLRKRDGRTQEDLAGAIGVTAQAISRREANGGYPNDAFASLECAYDCTAAYDAVSDGMTPSYTAPLLCHVSFCADKVPLHLTCTNLPEQWPVWCNPDYSQTEAEMKADPRWDAWVRKCSF